MIGVIFFGLQFTTSRHTNPTWFQYIMGEMITARDGRFYEVQGNQGASCRNVSFSFNQETIWFEVGTLWDAKLEFPIDIPFSNETIF